MALRAAFWVAAGLIVGFVLGGVPARREARTLRKERDALQSKLDRADRPNLFQGLLPQLATPSQDERTDEARSDDAPAAAPAIDAPAPAQPAPQLAPPPPARVAGRETGETRASEPSPARAFEGFDQFAVAQRARAAAARAALIDQAGLDAQQTARVDAAISRMNRELLGHADEILALARHGDMPPTLQMLGVGHDVSGILYQAQGELEGVLGDAANDVDGDSRAIWSYVDPDPWLPFVQKLAPARRAATGGAGIGASP